MRHEGQGSRRLGSHRLGVLHVVSSTDRRGAETAAVALESALARLGCDGSVVALAEGRSGGLGVPTLGPSRFSARTLASLRSAVKEHDVVVAHGSSTLPAVAAATLATGAPFVYRSIGDPRAWATTRARRARVRASLSRAAALVSLWRGAAAAWHQVIGIPPERIFVIPNGSDPERFRPATEQERAGAREEVGLPPHGEVALCLGAASPEKRVDVAIQAVALVPDVQLLVVGDGPEEGRLLDLARSLAGAQVTFLGQTDRPERSLAASDVLVIPSDTEGLPAAAIEAGLSGLPVAATRVGGMDEIVLPGRSGVLVEPGDPEALAEAVRACLADRTAMGALGRSHCSEFFDTARLAPRWLELLGSVVHGGSSS